MCAGCWEREWVRASSGRVGLADESFDAHAVVVGPFLEQHVLWLDVAVDDGRRAAMQVLDAVSGLLELPQHVVVPDHERARFSRWDLSGSRIHAVASARDEVSIV